MITRSQALSLIQEKVANQNVIKHMLATEAMMGALYDKFVEKGKTLSELGGTKEEWQIAGLLHDGDYNEDVPVQEQGIRIIQWAKEKGYEIPENVAHATAAHNCHNTQIQPQNLMDWSLFIGDSLTGLIVAATLVLPSKKLKDLTLENVINRFKEKSFARGNRREDILLCEEKLGLSFSEFIQTVLSAMQSIASELGL